MVGWFLEYVIVNCQVNQITREPATILQAFLLSLVRISPSHIFQNRIWLHIIKASPLVVPKLHNVLLFIQFCRFLFRCCLPGLFHIYCMPNKKFDDCWSLFTGLLNAVRSSLVACSLVKNNNYHRPTYEDNAVKLKKLWVMN